MKKGKSIIADLLIGTFLLVGLVGCVFISPSFAGPKKIKIRFSHIYGMGPASGPHVWIEKFRDLCNKELPGRVDIEEYGVSSLYRVTEVSKAAASGAIEVGYYTTAAARFALPKKSREHAVAIGLPGLFGSTGPITIHMLYDFMESYLEDISKKYYEPLGAVYRGFWCGSQSFQTVSMKPFSKLEDFKGVNIRGISNWVIELTKRLGGNPISMATSEVPGALLTGTVDAAMSWSDPIWRNKWYKTAPHILPMELLPAQAEGGWWWNLKWWNSLPKDIQVKFDAFSKKATEHVKEKIALPLAWNQEELFAADGAKIAQWKQADIDKVHQQIIEPFKNDWKKSAGKDGKYILELAERISKKYSSDKIKSLEKKYKGKIYPAGWEHLAK